MAAEPLRETPSQTSGPFLHIGLCSPPLGLRTAGEYLNVLTRGSPGAAAIRIEGAVFDGAGAPLRDAVVEIWQADAQGHYATAEFSGWGRAAADFETGEFWFQTIKPGATPWRDGRAQAPHVSLLIFGRGINLHLHTRLYFPEERAANQSDPVLLAVEPPRRGTLIAQRIDRGGMLGYRLEIHLQGDRETVFFDF